MATTLLAAAVALHSPVALQTAPSAIKLDGATAVFETTVSTGTNIPSPSGCTAPGYLAPSSLITTLGSNITKTSSGLRFKTIPKSDTIYGVLLLGAGALIALLILVGVAWAIVIGVTRAVRRSKGDIPGQRRSHTGRNIYIVLFLIAIVIFAPSLYILSPYISTTKVTSHPGGVLENIASPQDQIQILAPHSIKFFYEPAYANESTLLEGNFTVLSGADVQVVVIPDSLRADWFADLSNGTFVGVTGCNMAGISVYYDSGPVTSGAFAVKIPPPANLTTYDVIFADSSATQNVTLIANVYWGY